MKETFQIDADYRQVYIEDSESIGRLIPVWDDDTYQTRVMASGHSVVIITAINSVVPVQVELCDSRPGGTDFSEWDHVVECSIDIPSGILNVHGTTDYIGDYKKVHVSPGRYGVMIGYGGLGTASEDGFSADDSYAFFLWKDSKTIGCRVLKQFSSV